MSPRPASTARADLLEHEVTFPIERVYVRGTRDVSAVRVRRLAAGVVPREDERAVRERVVREDLRDSGSLFRSEAGGCVGCIDGACYRRRVEAVEHCERSASGGRRQRCTCTGSGRSGSRLQPGELIMYDRT